MNYIETGEITSLHGIRGEVKVYPWADYPEFLEEFDTFYIKKNKMHFQRLKDFRDFLCFIKNRSVRKSHQKIDCIGRCQISHGSVIEGDILFVRKDTCCKCGFSALPGTRYSHNWEVSA